MPRPPRCAECSKDMEAGYVPDFLHGGVGRSNWHRGEPESRSFLGMPAGLRVEKSEMIPVVAWRCASCGLLRLYANPGPPTRA